MLNLYITSSEYGEGKTFLTAGIAGTMQSLGYSTSVYKPIQTGGIEHNGFTQAPDLTFVKTIDPYINTAFSYLYKIDTEPLIASENENIPIDLEQIHSDYIKLVELYDCTIVDGIAGLFSPIAPSTKIIDLIKRLQIPVLYVVRPSKNSVNNTLIALESALERGIEVRGVIINNVVDDCPKVLLNSIPRVIEEYTNIKVLGIVPHLRSKFSPEDLITNMLNGIDIESIFNVKIEKLDME